jgi:hypothetical protein
MLSGCRSDRPPEVLVQLQSPRQSSGRLVLNAVQVAIKLARQAAKPAAMLALLSGALGGALGCGGTSGGSPTSNQASGGSGPSTGGRAGTGGASGGSSGNGIGSGGSVSVGTGGAGATGGDTSATGGIEGTGGAGAGGAPGTAGTDGTTGTGGATGVGGAGNAGGGGVPSGPPGVRIVGRTAPGTMGGTRFEWSGSNVSARFMGTQVSAQISDGNNGNSFEVVIDGGTPKQIFTVGGQTTYALATGLANGVHDVLLWRDSEASDGPTEFIGFTGFGTGGALLAPPPAPGRSIEIVGDSFSCGAGILAATPNCPAAIKIENHYLSYGAIAARAVTADLVTIAWSGIGVYRNYGTTTPTPTTVMPARYDYSIPTTQTAWDFTKFQPDVVVMNLNNNDFSVGNPGQPYIDAYLKLTMHIRSNYPNATFIHVIEWETGNTTDQSASTTVNQMVATLKAGGDMKHYVFDMRPYANKKQCGGHPDIPASQAMGAALAADLHTVMGW